VLMWTVLEGVNRAPLRFMTSKRFVIEFNDTSMSFVGKPAGCKAHLVSDAKLI
jgi:hypothetical protein